MTQYSSIPDTKKHIARVQQLLAGVIIDLQNRSDKHDQSKLEPPELECFDTHTPKLSQMEYNNPEYKQCLKEMQIGLGHHYAKNDHHPEYYGQNGIHDMGLIQLIEMFVDWKAGGERQNGCIYRSIEINASRFGYGDELKQILTNTATYFGYKPQYTVPDQVLIDQVLLAKDKYYTNAYNIIRFVDTITAGQDIELVFNCYNLTYNITADEDIDSISYNHILPKIVRLKLKYSNS